MTQILFGKFCGANLIIKSDKTISLWKKLIIIVLIRLIQRLAMKNMLSLHGRMIILTKGRKVPATE